MPRKKIQKYNPGGFALARPEHSPLSLERPTTLPVATNPWPKPRPDQARPTPGTPPATPPAKPRRREPTRQRGPAEANIPAPDRVQPGAFSRRVVLFGELSAAVGQAFLPVLLLLTATKKHPGADDPGKPSASRHLSPLNTRKSPPRCSQVAKNRATRG